MNEIADGIVIKCRVPIVVLSPESRSRLMGICEFRDGKMRIKRGNGEALSLFRNAEDVWIVFTFFTEHPKEIAYGVRFRRDHTTCSGIITPRDARATLLLAGLGEIHSSDIDGFKLVPSTVCRREKIIANRRVA